MMTREQIISALKGYFTAKELVCPHIYARFGEGSWQFLDTDYLHVLLVLRRDIFGVPMLCNHGASYERGMRCNLCNIVKSKTKAYLSAHVLGKAGDFTVTGMGAEQARQRIIANADKLPCKIRLEAGVTWLHIDTMAQIGQQDKVYLFKAN